MSPAAFDPESIRMRVARRLKEARESLKLSAAEAARRFVERTGGKMDRSQLERREDGQINLRVEELVVFADIYGKDGPGWFFL